jgi:Ca2+-binding RTX toxin-like protein
VTSLSRPVVSRPTLTARLLTARLLTAGVLTAAVLTGPVALSASAAALCAFSSGTVTVTLDGTPATVSRVAGNGGAVLVDGTPCDSATMDNTDTLVVNGDGLDDDLTLDYSQGAFEPGGAVEAGVSAIETIVDLGAGTDRVTVLLSPNDDAFSGGADGFDLISTDHQDLFLQGIENLTLDAGPGADTISLSDGTPWAGPARIQGGIGADTVTGGAGSDTFVATPAGTDTDSEADSYTGSSGTDTVDYTARTAGVTVDLGTGAGSGEVGEGDTVAGDIETVHTGQGDDVVFGTDGPQTIDTGDGNDTVYPLGGNDVVTLGVGADVVDAGSAPDGADTFIGDLDDTLDYTGRNTDLTLNLQTGTRLGEAGEGDQATGFGTVKAGNGSDTIIGSPLGEILVGGPGNDLIRGGGGADRLDGGDGNDRLTGNAGPDTLVGNGGNDVLRGLGGADTESGGPGADTFNQDAAANGRDVLSGGTGVDTADYSARGTALLIDLDNVADDGAAGEKDNVRADVENVRGGSRADKLTGSAAANRLEGGAGADVLDGLGGVDQLLCGGGPGADRAVKRPGDRYPGCEIVR